MAEQNKKNYFIDNNYSVHFAGKPEMFSEGVLVIPKEVQSFFGTAGDSTRVLLIFEGREYPSYVEMHDGGAYKLTLSRPLHNKFIYLFPDYQKYFERHPEYEDGDPLLTFEKYDEETFLLSVALPDAEGISLKQDFFKAIFPGNATGSFEDSYEIVFLLSFFQNIDAHWKTEVMSVAEKVVAFYKGRQEIAPLLDKNAKKNLEHIQDMETDEALDFLLEGPYQKYAANGMMTMEAENEKFYFGLPQTMVDEMVTDDKRLILELLMSKLENYFKHIDGPNLSENLSLFVHEYASYTTRDFRYSYKDLITSGIPGSIEALPFYDGSQYRVVGFAGDRSWAEIPWIQILDREITRTPNSGVFLGYYLNKDEEKLYLTLSAAADVRDSMDREDIYKRVSKRDFDIDPEGIELTDENLVKGILFYKVYDRELPNGETIEADFENALNIYTDYKERIVQGLYPESFADDDEKDDATLNVEDLTEELDGEELDKEEPEASDESETTAPEALIEDGADAVKASATEDSKSEEVVPEVESAASEVKTEAEAPTPETPKNNPVEKAKEVHPSEPQNTPPATINSKPHKKTGRSTTTNRERIEPETKAEESSFLWEHEIKAEEGLINPNNIKDTLVDINRYIESRGFNCEPRLVENIYLSLKAKPFVILTGIAGIGKTGFIRYFAEAVGATVDNGRFKQVPIRPDWRDSRGLLGYVDASGYFIPGALNDYIRAAITHPDMPFFLCLDEMGAARVEFYFSELLSVMESRRESGGAIVTDPLLGRESFGRDNGAYERYGALYLPENLYIIGTYTADKWGDGISPRVLDRAGLIELTHVGLHLGNRIKANPLKLKNRFLKSDDLELTKISNSTGMINEVIALLEAMNGILVKSGAQIGSRVRDEICFYLAYNADFDLMGQEEALDHAIVQKIIPRIQGEGASVEAVLIDLYKICAGTREEDAIRSEVVSGRGLFPKSAAKLREMMTGFDAKGVVSFWN